MATSGTVSFKETRDELITDACLDAGIVALGQQLEPDTINFAARKLNLMLKAWQADGLNLWKIKETTLFLQRAQNKYTLGPISSADNSTTGTVTKTTLSSSAAANATVLSLTSTAGLSVGDNIGIELDSNTMFWTTIVNPATTAITSGLSSAASSGNTVYSYTTKAQRPLAIWDLMRRDRSDNDVPVMVISKNEYYSFGNKATSGTPTNFLFIPTTNEQVAGSQTSTLWCYVSPSRGDDRLVFNGQYPVDDMTSANQDFDCPQEWLLAIQTNLAVLLSPSSATTSSEFQKLKMIANEEKNRVMGWDRENTSMYLSPTRRFST